MKRGFSNLSDGVHPMTHEHIPEVSDLLAGQLSKDNPVWKKSGLSRQELQDYLAKDMALILDSALRLNKQKGRKIVLSHVNSEIRQIYTLKGNLVFAVMHYDLNEHCRIQREHPPSLAMTKTISQAVFPLEQSFGYQHYLNNQQGGVLYGAWGVGNSVPFLSRTQNYAMMVHATLSFYQDLHRQGYYLNCSRSTSHRTPLLMHLQGGSIVARNEFIWQGEKKEVYMTAIDFRSTAFQEQLKTYQALTQQILNQVKLNYEFVSVMQYSK